MKKTGIAVAALAPMLAFGGMFSGRSGEIFQTTREGPGVVSLGLIYIGVMVPPVGILTVPAGIAVGLVDELVISPAVDLVCLPYDLLQPHHGFVVRMRDADGQPVAGAKVHAQLQTGGHMGGVIKGTTDAKGELFVSKMNKVTFNYLHVQAEGCHDYREYTGNNHKVDKSLAGADGRIVFDFVIKRKVRPVDKAKAHMELPDSLRYMSGELYFDCEAGDWLPPHGEGKVADLKVVKTFECKDGSNPGSGNRRTISIEAVGPGNGFLKDACNWFDGMPGAYEVPACARFEDKLEPSVSSWHWDDENATKNKEFDESTYMLMRLRTRLSEDGQVIGAHYGKLLFHVGTGSLAQTQFVLNENEKRVE